MFGVSTVLLVTRSHVLFSIAPLSRELGSDSVSLQTETNQELHKGLEEAGRVGALRRG